MTFGTCAKCKMEDVFINENGLCNYCDSYEHFAAMGITTLQGLQAWKEKNQK
jgi:hypothetical protein